MLIQNTESWKYSHLSGILLLLLNWNMLLVKSRYCNDITCASKRQKPRASGQFTQQPVEFNSKECNQGPYYCTNADFLMIIFRVQYGVTWLQWVNRRWEWHPSALGTYLPAPWWLNYCSLMITWVFVLLVPACPTGVRNYNNNNRRAELQNHGTYHSTSFSSSWLSQS